MKSSAEGSSYYGGFFWLAAVSFVVPLFVAIYAFDAVRPTSKPVASPDASGVDHNLFDYLLRTYVENGLIDYTGISRDHLFQTYLRQLAAADPEKLETDEARLALHCNAYNALVIHGVIIHEIHRNEKNVLRFTPPAITAEIEDLKTQVESEERTPNPNRELIEELNTRIGRLKKESGFFSLEEHIFAGKTMSLDHLEHRIIRPVFQEPRIHVALVCAARSCPAIRPEAYDGERIDSQLEDQAVQFANNPRYVDYIVATGTLKLSPILNWYGEDWDESGGYLAWLAERVESGELRSRLLEAAEGSVDVQFNSYDWTLNSQAGGQAPGGGGGGFGSGSVPNE